MIGRGWGSLCHASTFEQPSCFIQCMLCQQTDIREGVDCPWIIVTVSFRIDQEAVELV